MGRGGGDRDELEALVDSSGYQKPSNFNVRAVDNRPTAALGNTIHPSDTKRVADEKTEGLMDNAKANAAVEERRENAKRKKGDIPGGFEELLGEEGANKVPLFLRNPVYNDEQNREFQDRVLKKMNDIKNGLIEKYQKRKEKMNKLNAFDEGSNTIRVQAMFHVEMKRRMQLTTIMKEVIYEMENVEENTTSGLESKFDAFLATKAEVDHPEKENQKSGGEGEKEQKKQTQQRKAQGPKKRRGKQQKAETWEDRDKLRAEEMKRIKEVEAKIAEAAARKREAEEKAEQERLEQEEQERLRRKAARKARRKRGGRSKGRGQAEDKSGEENQEDVPEEEFSDPPTPRTKFKLGDEEIKDLESKYRSRFFTLMGRYGSTDYSELGRRHDVKKKKKGLPAIRGSLTEQRSVAEIERQGSQVYSPSRPTKPSPNKVKGSPNPLLEYNAKESEVHLNTAMKRRSTADLKEKEREREAEKEKEAESKKLSRRRYLRPADPSKTGPILEDYPPTIDEKKKLDLEEEQKAAKEKNLVGEAQFVQTTGPQQLYMRAAHSIVSPRVPDSLMSMETETAYHTTQTGGANTGYDANVAQDVKDLFTEMQGDKNARDTEGVGLEPAYPAEEDKKVAPQVFDFLHKAGRDDLYNDMDEELPLEVKGDPNPIPLQLDIHTRLDAVWQALQTPVMQRLDMVIKYTTHQFANKLEAAILDWEGVKNMVVQREAMLAEYRVLKRQDESSMEDDAAKRKVQLQIEADNLGAEIRGLCGRLLKKYGDVLTYAGRPYLEKMEEDRPWNE